MKRDLAAMAARPYDVIIIGAGATGAAIAWDAALRGFRVALIDKGDFGHATSAASSKLIHGGLRYLRNGEIALVRESLAERRIWLKIAPHLVHPLANLVPLGAGLKAGAVLGTGLALYDLLSFDRNRIDDPDKRIPGFKFISALQANSMEPVLTAGGISGAFIYGDAQMVNPERLVLEMVAGAVERGAAAANRLEATAIMTEGTAVSGVNAHCTLTGREITLKAPLVINAAGPWADHVAGRVLKDTAPKIVRSKGIHLIVPNVTRSHALVLQTPAGHAFALPWRGHTILGTTDTRDDSPLDQIGVTVKEAEDFLGLVNGALPGARLSLKDVVYHYAGIRPIVDDGGGDTYGASRRPEVVDHGARDGLQGFYSAIGGKWTTSRRLAQKVVDLIDAKVTRWTGHCETDVTPLPGGQTGRFASFTDRLELAHPGLDRKVIDTLAVHYGAKAGEVLALGRDDPSLLAPLSGALPETLAAVIYAVRAEMALTLDDVLFRRTGIGTLGHPGDDVVGRVGQTMARELGWDGAEEARQIDQALARYQFAGGS